jgi:3-phenylpropionate/cinnamic acid dioxygenase small subunit
MSSNTQQLLSKLKSSLPKMDSGLDSSHTVHVFPEPRIEKVSKGTRAPKLSVSLYQYDIDRLDTIKDFMKAQGFRNLSDSEALRLACRKVEIDGNLVNVYKSMQSEDGRRR